ncbi:MAG: SapC family protein [Sphingomonadales bacterium]
MSEEQQTGIQPPANDGANQGSGQNQLPPLYNNLVPLNPSQHANLSFRPTGDFKFARDLNAVPVMAEEFPLAQRNYPIMFTTGKVVQPLAILGLREGENMFVNDKGEWQENAYIPAYVRRYPFLLARLRPDDDRLSLCIDDTAPGVSNNGEDKLFNGNEPTELTNNVLKFCEQFDVAGARTRAFCEKMTEMKLFEEGEAVLQGPDKPIRFTGLTSISEKALRELKDEQILELTKQNYLPIIHAQLFSLSAMRGLITHQG